MKLNRSSPTILPLPAHLSSRQEKYFIYFNVKDSKLNPKKKNNEEFQSQ